MRILRIDNAAIILRKFGFYGGGHSETGGTAVMEELVRMAITWRAMCGLPAFFYWMLSNIGTF